MIPTLAALPRFAVCVILLHLKPCPKIFAKDKFMAASRDPRLQGTYRVVGPWLIVRRGKICSFNHFLGYDGVGWGRGPNNVLLLHPHRRVFLGYHSYVMVHVMVYVCGCYTGTTSVHYGCNVTDAMLVLRLHATDATLAPRPCTLRMLCWYHVCTLGMSLGEKTWDTWSCPFLAPVDQNLVKMRPVYSHFAQKKKVHFCRHRPQKPK